MTRRNRTPIAVVTMCITVLLVAALSVRPAAAQPSDLPPTDDPITTMGIGQGVRVWTDNVDIFQCPGTHCNQGEAHTGQDIALICKLNSNSWRNNWLLVLNRGWNNDYNAVGWIEGRWIAGVHYEPPLCSQVPHNVAGVVAGQAIAYQCPHPLCNPSSPWIRGDVIWTFCDIAADWHLSLNWSRGLLQVGFLFSTRIVNEPDC